METNIKYSSKTTSNGVIYNKVYDNKHNYIQAVDIDWNNLEYNGMSINKTEDLIVYIPQFNFDYNEATIEDAINNSLQNPNTIYFITSNE